MTTFQDRTEELLTDLRDRTRPCPEPSSSWGSRLVWLAMGAGIGAAAALLSDDGRATDRRERLGDRAREIGEDVRTSAQHQLEVQRGRAQGAANRLRGGDADDPKLLRQRIRSEVVGRVDGAEDVVVVVHDAGRVELKGLVSSRETADELVDGARRIPGVEDVTESLQVNAASS